MFKSARPINFESMTQASFSRLDPSTSIWLSFGLCSTYYSTKFVSKLSSTKAAKPNICSLTQLGLRAYIQHTTTIVRCHLNREAKGSIYSTISKCTCGIPLLRTLGGRATQRDLNFRAEIESSCHEDSERR